MPIERSGGGGVAAAAGLVKLFDSTLGASATTIDTGANGVAAGHTDLIIYLIGKTDIAAFQNSIGIRFNGDSGANYDYAWLRNNASVIADVHDVGGTSASPGSFPGTSVGGSYPGVIVATVPSYTQTTFWKHGSSTGGTLDNAGTHYQTMVTEFGWRSTAAINQVTLLIQQAGNLIAGSRMVVYGTQ